MNAPTLYKELKDSQNVWLGKVPSHWAVLPHRAIFDEIKDVNKPSADLLSVTIKRGIIPQSVLLANSSKKDSSRLDKSKYKHVKVGDLAYNKMRAWQGALGISKFEGIVSPAYVVQRPRNHLTVPQYYHYLMRTPAFHKEAERWSYGITSDMWSLRPEHFKMIYSLLPPPDEQAAIVKYLDHTTARLDRAIAAKRRVIKLLEEQKQAIIHRAVTRGLDEASPLKNSGVPWLGMVPKAWKIVRAKDIWTERDERSDTGKEELLSVSHLTGVTPRSQKSINMFKASSYVGSKLCQPGDLVINTMWAWMGAMGVSDHHGVLSPSYGVYSPKLDGHKKDCYHEYLLKTSGYIDAYNLVSRGITPSRVRLYPELFLRMKVLSPPLDDRIKIEKFIRVSTRKLVSSIDTIKKEIFLLEEFRTALISEVVTGKRDVRTLAAALPEVQLEDENPFDEDEGLDDDLIEEALA